MSQFKTFQNNSKQLCRICANTGLIGISETIKPKLQVRNEEIGNYNEPIRVMLAVISGEDVNLDDGLPQFICTSCLFYLHHAFEMHLKIRESSLTFRTALLLVAEAAIEEEPQKFEEEPQSNDDEPQEPEDVILSTIKPQTNNKSKKNKKLEANFPKLDIALEIENLESLGGHAPIKLKNYKNPIPYTERKCSACFHRCLEAESFEKHEANCVILKLEQLFCYLQDLRNMRISSQIDNEEFVLRAISALRAIQEKCDKFWEEKGLTNIILSETTVVFDEVSAKKNHDYHKMKHSKYTSEFIMNDYEDSVKLHFSNND